jgi:hypothetical protein
MNNSQLLYKISNLQYSIRMKEIEYSKAVNAGDQISMDLVNAALKLLKEDLAATVKVFNTIPPHSSDNRPIASKKTRWWQSFFNLRASFKK